MALSSRIVTLIVETKFLQGPMEPAMICLCPAWSLYLALQITGIVSIPATFQVHAPMGLSACGSVPGMVLAPQATQWFLYLQMSPFQKRRLQPHISKFRALASCLLYLPLFLFSAPPTEVPTF